MSEEIDRMEGLTDGEPLTREELIESLWKCKNDLAHQKELVRVLAEELERFDKTWFEDEYRGLTVTERIAWAEAQVKEQKNKEECYE